MSDDYGDIYQSAMAGYKTAIAEEQLNFQRAEASYDFAERVRAAQSIAALRSQAAEFDRMSHEHAASLRPPAPAQRGEVDLTPREAMQVAGLDPNKAEDVSIYNQGAARLARLKAQGHYRE